jgi:BMFP domain-containing protein YqiC
MRIATDARTSRIARAKQIWAELDYAQRRLFEIQTGIASPARERRSTLRRSGDDRRR